MNKNKNSTVNPAIAYSTVMKLLESKMNDGITDENREIWKAWGHLYELSYYECTHRNSDGESSWKYPFEELGIKRKVCDYCPRN